ncbi:MAG: radical SAM protein [Candidatus Methanomethylicaceae archaeon]
MKYVFGPVPSRRLGNSLGVNNIPRKYCSYSCIYCQVGRTTNLTIDRRAFFDPNEVICEVVSTVNEFRGRIDYITFVPDGEPTLDINLGNIIKGIKENVTHKVAVITNGSVIGSAYADLMEADLVSIKIDAAVEEIYRRINRPHPRVTLSKVFEDLAKFNKIFSGTFITETMLVNGVNDGKQNLTKIAEILTQISPRTAYLSLPVRPPAEPWVKPSSKVMEWRDHFKDFGIKVSVLDYQEEGMFSIAGFEDPLEGILKIMAVHPLKEDYAIEILTERKLNANQIIDQLISKGKICRIEYNGKHYLTLVP